MCMSIAKFVLHYKTSCSLTDSDIICAAYLVVLGCCYSSDSISPSACIILVAVADRIEVHQCCPALVRGEKEVELAIAEGKYPVIDILTDVFAISSASGELDSNGCV